MNNKPAPNLADYVDVAERIRLFREAYPEGSLQPANLEKPFELITIHAPEWRISRSSDREITSQLTPDDKGGVTFLVYVAAAYRHPNDPRPGIGMAWERVPGSTPFTKESELMVAETSAWGRAIVATLAADSRRVASLDEVRNRRAMDEHPATVDPSRAPEWPQNPATEAQERALYAMSKKLDKLPPAKGTLTKSQAGKLIETLQAEIDGKKENQEEPF